MGTRPRHLAAGAPVVIDTGVVLSALVFSGGALNWLRSAWQVQRIRPCVSQATVTELIRVLAYPKFRLTAAERNDLLADYLPHCRVVTVPARGALLPQCRDPFDVPFLALAIAAKSAALVSSDKHLLELAPSFPVPIVAPGKLREWLE